MCRNGQFLYLTTLYLLLILVDVYYLIDADLLHSTFDTQETIELDSVQGKIFSNGPSTSYATTSPL